MRPENRVLSRTVNPSNTRFVRQYMARTGKLTLVFCLLLLSSAIAFAQQADLTGEQIAQRTLRGDAFGWDGAKTRLRMTLAERGGSARTRVMEILGRRSGGLLQTVVRFLSPQDVAGTAFLMLEQRGQRSEQHIYLPGLRRTRRIVGRETEGSFMGSDFTYADMQGVDPKHATHTRLPNENVGNTPCYVVESTIKPEAHSAYAKTQSWVRTTDYLPLRTRFFDRAGTLLKTLYTRRVGELNGKPIVMEARMENQANGHHTELVVEAIERSDGLPDTVFTPSALEHW